MRDDKLGGDAIVYRGSKLTQNIVDSYKDIKQKGEVLTLRGFTSTSESKDVAFGFMFNQLKPSDVPVLYQIQGVDSFGYSYFRLNMKEYAIFLNEKEVLFRSGMEFKILDISE